MVPQTRNFAFDFRREKQLTACIGHASCSRPLKRMRGLNVGTSRAGRSEQNSVSQGERLVRLGDCEVRRYGRYKLAPGAEAVLREKLTAFRYSMTSTCRNWITLTGRCSART
jgi:hypothetical protein